MAMRSFHCLEAEATPRGVFVPDAPSSCVSEVIPRGAFEPDATSNSFVSEGKEDYRALLVVDPAGVAGTRDRELAGISAELSSSDDDQFPITCAHRRWTKRSVVSIAVASACLLASVVYYFVAVRQPRQGADGAAHAAAQTPSVRQLLTDPQMVSVIADNLMAATGDDKREDALARRAEVEKVVHLAVVGARESLESKYPVAARRLHEMQLQPEQQAALLKVMHGMRDPGVATLGRDIIHELHESLHRSKSVELSNIVRSHEREIQRLQNSVMPASRRSVANADNLDESRVHIARTVSKWHVDFEIQPASAPAPVGGDDVGFRVTGDDGTLDVAGPSATLGRRLFIDEMLDILAGHVKSMADLADSVSAKVDEHSSSVQGKVDAVGEQVDRIQGHVTGVKDKATGIFDTMKETYDGFMATITEQIDALDTWMSEMGLDSTGLLNRLEQIDFLKGAVENVRTAYDQLEQDYSNTVGAAVDSATGEAAYAVESGTLSLQQQMSAIGDAFEDVSMFDLGSCMAEHMASFELVGVATCASTFAENGMDVLDAMSPVSTYAKTKVSEGEGQCFPGEALVHVQNGGPMPVAHLRQGDRVLVERQPGTFQFEEVLGFLHTIQQPQSSYLEVRHRHGLLRASASHLVFVYDSAGRSRQGAGGRVVKRMVDLQVGDRLIAATLPGKRGVGGEVLSEVLAISHGASALGMYAPLTASGTIAVGGAVASIYADTTARQPGAGPLLPHGLAHGVLFPVRAYHALKLPQLLALLGTFGSGGLASAGESTARSAFDELHPFLELMYHLSLDSLLWRRVAK